MAKQRRRGIIIKAVPNLKKTPENKAKFLEMLAFGYSVSKAAAAIDCSRALMFQWKKADAEFAANWADAMEAGIDRLEDEAMRRAVEGVSREVLYQGEGTGHHIVEYSDALLTLLLRGKRANVFNTDRVEHTGPGGGPMEHNITLEFVKAPKRKKGDDD